MSLITNKRRLPNVNNRLLLNSNLYNTENDIGSTRSSVEKVRNKNKNDLSKQDSTIEEVQLHFNQQLQEMKRKLISSIHNNDEKTSQYESQIQNSKRQREEIELKSSQNSTTLRECAKSIRENVTQFKNNLMRNEITKDEELSSLVTRRRKPEQDHRQIENEYLIHQRGILSKSTALNEMLSFKKELEKSEKQREELSDNLESIIKTSNDKEKLISKNLIELKEMTENCDTYQRQNMKLQHDLTLALEKLEEMTDEAERFAQESLNSQKQLADSEQKQEEYQIQSQETIKQWNARVKKLEKDIDRYKFDSIQMLEKQEQLIKENQTLKTQNFTLKEQNTKTETNLNERNINYKQLEEQFQENENNIIHLRSIQSSQQIENATLKEAINELESQRTIQRQRISQLEKEKENLQELYQEEIRHRNNLHLNFKQSEKSIEILNTSYSQLQNEHKIQLQKLKEIQIEKDLLIQEKTKFLSMENDYEEIKKKIETTKIDYTRGMKALQMDYENKFETILLQLSNEKSQNIILQRHELEYKNEIERLREKSNKYEDENNQKQFTIETLSREIDDKCRLIDEFEIKIKNLIIEITNQKNEFINEKTDYENSLENIYKDIIYCTECLSNDSNKPFIIEPTITPRNNIEIYSSKLKAHLAWLKQELEIRYQQENKLRQDLNNALMDCETDRKYFATELAKREIIINQLTNNYEQNYTEYNEQQILVEDERDPIDHRYQQFQIMIDSVKRELHTAKVQLLS